MKELYKLHAEMCKVFSNPIRLEILDILRGKEMSVTGLVEKTGLSQANISQHLSIMKSKGIVAPRRKSRYVYYGLTNPKIIRAFDIIREVLRGKLKKDKEIIEGFRQ